VEVTEIELPDWALDAAVPGLSQTATTIWLKRIAARGLARLDRKAGGRPKLTWTRYRWCKVCRRARLGLDAERRWELDKKAGGEGLPCGPDCIELERVRKQRVCKERARQERARNRKQENTDGRTKSTGADPG
jgi:hypothetical protein